MWSKEGITQLGLLTQQYELAQYQIQQYNKEIDELNAQYLAGRYSATEYADRLAELNSSMWDSVKSSESAKDAIMDLNEARVENAVKGIEKEIDAYKKLIDAQLDALGREKELHDYKQSIADKNKTVIDLERQIAAMQYDTSASGIARRKQLEEQLLDAKKTLEEAEYEHSIEIQQEALNKQYENYEKERNDEIEKLRESLNERDTVIAESFETVKENASLVGQEIAQIAVEHGITISDALISSWQSGEMAIAGYGETLSQNTSAFIGNIMGVENEVWNLQAQANNTANSLAWMFSTKADSLVNELAASYYAESNLASMTNALQQSLVNTLERGYDVSSIVNSLASIENAANSAKAAIEALNNTPSTGGYKNDSGSSGGTKDTKGGQQYQLIDNMTGRVWKDNLSYEEAIKLKKDHNVDIHTTMVKKYANGTRNAKDGLRIVDEKGKELTLPKLAAGRYAVGNAGDQILTKQQTDNVFEWAKIDPGQMNSMEFINKLWGNARIQEPMVNKKMNASVNNYYDSMFAFNGDVIDAQRALKQMEKVAIKISNQEIDKSWREFSDELKYN